MDTPLLILIGVIVTMLVVIRFAYNYKVQETCVEVVVFGVFPLLRVPFDDIEEIKRISSGEALGFGFLTSRLGNRLWGKIVLIRRRSGLSRNVLITPGKADEFVNQVRERLGQSRSETIEP